MSEAHGSEEILPNETYINTAGVVGWLIGMVLLLPILLVGVYSYFMVVSQETIRAQNASIPNTELNEARAGWKSDAESYGVVDKDAQRYRVPIDVAKGLFVKANAAKIAEMERLAAERAAQLEAEGELMEGEGDPAPEAAPE